MMKYLHISNTVIMIKHLLSQRFFFVKKKDGQLKSGEQKT